MPTVRYRGRTAAALATASPTTTATDAAGATAVATTAAWAVAAPPTTAPSTPPTAPATAPAKAPAEDDQAASAPPDVLEPELAPSVGPDTASDESPAGTVGAAEKQNDQWHHKMSVALGFQRPRHHLTKRETAGVVVLAVLALTGSLPGGQGTVEPPAPPVEPTPSGPAPGESGATAWSLEQEFASGDFVLEIDSYQDRLAELAGPGSVVAENGRWVLVGITVRNTGDEDGTFLPDQQVLVTEQGAEHANEPASALKHADFVLGIYPIKPGGSQTGFLAFDIPLEERPVELRLVGRISEPAVKVPLG
ncbi:MAG: DUF4352 domain-containing protein [Bifidobacteriaceae bacterium]|nr:DUF4352 domain-containing protein [Bifidobacteriaceae bacterium]